MSFSYHLMFVDELWTSLSPNEVEAAVRTATALATDSRDDIACGVESDGVARELLYASDEMCLCNGSPTAHNGIGEYNEVTPREAVAIYPIHYHSGTRLEVGRKPSCRNREDSEDVGVDCPYKEQCQHQRDEVFDGYFH